MGGDTLGACVGLAYVAEPGAATTSLGWARSDGFTVDVGGTTFPVVTGTRPPYDPDGERIR